jgi:hypothetical protein
VLALLQPSPAERPIRPALRRDCGRAGAERLSDVAQNSIDENRMIAHHSVADEQQHLSLRLEEGEEISKARLHAFPIDPKRVGPLAKLALRSELVLRRERSRFAEERVASGMMGGVIIGGRVGGRRDDQIDGRFFH